MIGNKDFVVHRMGCQGTNRISMQFHHCGMQECTPGYLYGFYMVPYQLIHFVLAGSGLLELQDQRREVKAGEMFYIPAGSAARYRASENCPWKYAWIGFFADMHNPVLETLFGQEVVKEIDLELDTLQGLLLSVIGVGNERVQKIADYREKDFSGEQFHTITSFTQSLEVNSRMMHLFSCLLECQNDKKASVLFSEEKDYAAEARAFIDSSFCEPVKVQDVADALHIHPSYLSEVFRKAYGKPPKKYLNALRMERATQLLKHSNLPVSMVGKTVGIEDAFQFSAAFKKYYGISPAQYRKKEKKD